MEGMVVDPVCTAVLGFAMSTIARRAASHRPGLEFRRRRVTAVPRRGSGMQPAFGPSASMHPSRFLPLLSLILAGISLPTTAIAQWATTPHNPAAQLFDGGWYVVHDTPAGVEAISAIGQTWRVLSPSGSTIVHTGDSLVVTEEAGFVLRGWSALHDSSATQTFSASHSTQVGTQFLTSYCILKDNVPGTNGVLRAYSAYTNTWSSLALPSVPNTSLTWGLNAAVQKEGLNYHAYSAYTGQWVTLTTTVAGGFPISGVDYVATDLRFNNGGAFQYAAFSAPRGVWTLSPNYPSTGGSGVQAIPNCSVLAIKVPDPAPNSFRYAAYSPYTAQWATSTMVHTTTAAPSVAVRTNLIRVLDTNVAARCEMFGAGNGIWQSLTGANYAEMVAGDGVLVMRSPTSNPTVVWFASAMVGGGFTSVSVPGAIANVTVSPHGGILYGGVDQTTSQAWGYSASANAVLGPEPLPTFPGFYSLDGTGCAFAIQATGQVMRAFSTRHGNWVDGPMTTGTGWLVQTAGTSLAVVSGSLVNTLTPFDEHANVWLPARTDGPRVLGPNSIVLRHAGGNYDGLSLPTGQWSTVTGVGTINSNGGLPRAQEALTWFHDSTRLYVFCAPDVTQTWWQYPASTRFGQSGTVGGVTPYLGVSLRGNANADFALLYASLGLSPSPLTIPGLTGTLDLDLNAIQLGAGFLGAGGVLPLRLPMPAVLPASTLVYLQGVLVDLTNGQVRLGGRATSTTFF